MSARLSALDFYGTYPVREIQPLHDSNGYHQDDVDEHLADHFSNPEALHVAFPVFEGDEILQYEEPMNDKTLRSLELPDVLQIYLDLVFWYVAKGEPLPDGDGNGLPTNVRITERTLYDRTFLRADEILGEAARAKSGDIDGHWEVDNEAGTMFYEDANPATHVDIHTFFGWGNPNPPRNIRNYDVLLEANAQDTSFGRRGLQASRVVGVGTRTRLVGVQHTPNQGFGRRGGLAAATVPSDRPISLGLANHYGIGSASPMLPLGHALPDLDAIDRVDAFGRVQRTADRIIGEQQRQRQPYGITRYANIGTRGFVIDESSDDDGDGDLLVIERETTRRALAQAQLQRQQQQQQQTPRNTSFRGFGTMSTTATRAATPQVAVGGGSTIRSIAASAGLSTRGFNPSMTSSATPSSNTTAFPGSSDPAANATPKNQAASSWPNEKTGLHW